MTFEFVNPCVLVHVPTQKHAFEKHVDAIIVMFSGCDRVLAILSIWNNLLIQLRCFLVFKMLPETKCVSAAVRALYRSQQTIIDNNIYVHYTQSALKNMSFLL